MAEESSSEKIARLEREIEALKAENERLRRLLEEAIRAGKRRAAPFSRQKPKANPNTPGRKSGKDYGRPCRRPIPKSVDEVIEVPLLPSCLCRIHAETNYDLTEQVRARELSNSSYYDRQYKHWEDETKDPNDVLIEADEIKRRMREEQKQQLASERATKRKNSR